MSAEEKQALMEKNILVELKQVISLLILKYWGQTAGFIAIVSVFLVFYFNTKTTNADYPIFKKEMQEFKGDILKAINSLVVKVEVVSTKVDDMNKANVSAKIDANNNMIKTNEKTLELQKVK